MKELNVDVLGKSSAFTQALEHLSQLAPLDRPALIIGERGTGKEIAAERLHFLSDRWDKALIKINCAALSETLLEAELFGHETGAFTGASKSRQGRFERANGGTLFMDELGALSMTAQEKLLRVIEYGEFERVGGQQTLSVDVRIVAATNQDLREAVTQHEFRADLLDRLSFDVIHLPPLRYRQDDILELAQHFAQRMCRELSRDFFPGFSSKVQQELKQYAWPGNVRELKNVVERSLYRWHSEDTAVDEIIFDPFTKPYEETYHLPQETYIEPTIKQDKQINKPHQLPSNMGLYEYLNSIERAIVENSLAEHHQHQGRTAEALELSYHQLRGLVRKYKLASKGHL